MDPVETLKSGIAKGRTVERKGGFIFIGSHGFPEKTFTCMKKFGVVDTKNTNKEDAFYTLDSLFFFWKVFSKNPNTDQASYALQCVDNGVDPISFPQKEGLLDYLKGKSSKCEYFELNVPFRYVKPTAGVASSGVTVEQGAGDKKSEKVVSIQSYKRLRTILGNEKVYETRSKIIAVNGKSSFTEAVRCVTLHRLVD